MSLINFFFDGNAQLFIIPLKLCPRGQEVQYVEGTHPSTPELPHMRGRPWLENGPLYYTSV